MQGQTKKNLKLNQSLGPMVAHLFAGCQFAQKGTVLKSFYGTYTCTGNDAWATWKR